MFGSTGSPEGRFEARRAARASALGEASRHIPARTAYYEAHPAREMASMISRIHGLAWAATVAVAACLAATPAAASFESCVKTIRAEVLRAGIRPDIVN